MKEELEHEEDSIEKNKRQVKLIPHMNLKELDEFQDNLEGTCQMVSYYIYNPNEDAPINISELQADLNELESYFEQIETRRKILLENQALDEYLDKTPK